MKRLGLLVAGASLWLFLAASSVLADGGVHITSLNSGTGTSGLTADTCAGCHRAHTAKAEYLLIAASEQALCLSCHNGTGATTNVLLGIQYVPTGTSSFQQSTVLGALRDGGFIQARIDSGNAIRASYVRGFENGPINTEYAISTRPKVGVKGTSSNITSAHIDVTGVDYAEVGANGIADRKTVWGKGELNSGVGTASVTLTCVECHNPHGNGNYRILRPVPGVEATPLGEPEPMTIKASYANFSTLVTESQHGLTLGDKVTIIALVSGTSFDISAVDVAGVFTTTGAHGFTAGQKITLAGTALTGYPAGEYTINTAPTTTTFTLTTGTPGTAYTYVSGPYPTAAWTISGTYYVQTVTNGFTFKIATTFSGSAVAVPNYAGLTAAVLRPEVVVADYPVGTPVSGIYPTKNYTVMQVKGAQGVDSTFLLYAQDVIDAAAGNGIAADQTPVSINQTTNGGSGTTYYFETTGNVAHGLAVGDLVTITGGPWPGFTPGAGPYTVASVASSGTVNDRFTLATVTVSGNDGTDGSVTRKGIPGTYTAGGGDYFRRTVPWNPKTQNANCDLTFYGTTSALNAANAAYCATMNDAPNGRPSTITSGASSLIGQQAFLDQISPWCSQCHTRYYQNSNENLEGAEVISKIENRGIGRLTTADEIYALYYSPNGQYGSPAYGDKVTFAGIATDTALNTGEWYVVATGSSSGRNWFKVSATMGGAPFDITANQGTGSAYAVSVGTFTRVYQSSNSGWGYPREDSIYKFQHSTASNRACTVCHVAHGSNAAMSGRALDVLYPDGVTTSTSSRLLKVDNRGTCQMCHDPTGTVLEGTYVGTVYGLATYNVIP